MPYTHTTRFYGCISPVRQFVELLGFEFRQFDICRTVGTSNCWDVELLGFPPVRRPSSSNLSNCWDVELVGIPVVRRTNCSTSQQFDKCRTDGTRIPVVRHLKNQTLLNYWDLNFTKFKFEN